MQRGKCEADATIKFTLSDGPCVCPAPLDPPLHDCSHRAKRELELRALRVAASPKTAVDRARDPARDSPHSKPRGSSSSSSQPWPAILPYPTSRHPTPWSS